MLHSKPGWANLPILFETSTSWKMSLGGSASEKHGSNYIVTDSKQNKQNNNNDGDANEKGFMFYAHRTYDLSRPILPPSYVIMDPKIMT